MRNPATRLKDICETLFSWIGEADHGRKGAPGFSNWRQDDWKAAAIAAFVHGIGPYLHWELDRKRELQNRISPKFLNYLSDQYRLNHSRISRMLALKDELDKLFGESGPEVLPLKGLLLIPHFRSPAMRPMADLDFLATPEDMDMVCALLSDRGFEITEETFRHTVFLPPPCFGTQSMGYDENPDFPTDLQSKYYLGEHPKNPCFIEIHDHLREQYWGTGFDITEDYRKKFGSSEAAAAVLFHILLHTGKNALRSTLRMIQLIDIALLANKTGAAAWEDLLRWSDKLGTHRFIYAPLLFANRYLGPAVPFELIETVESKCPAPLVRMLNQGTLADLSNCNPRQSSVVRNLKWFVGPEEKIRATIQIALGESGKKKVKLRRGETAKVKTGSPKADISEKEGKSRLLSLLKTKLRGGHRAGWEVFSQEGFSDRFY